MRRVGVFIAAYVVWLLLVFPYDPMRTGPVAKLASAWDLQSILLGLVAALIVAILLPPAVTREPSKLLNPVRWFWGAVYLPVLFYEILRANLQVAYIVLHPDLPIRPGTVRVRTSLKSDSGRAALANSITLTPGTLSVDIDDEEGVLYVHWLTVEAEDEEGATRMIVSRFEPLLKRIFE